VESKWSDTGGRVLRESKWSLSGVLQAEGFKKYLTSCIPDCTQKHGTCLNYHQKH
jgi:hypothetical protein